MPPDRTPLLSEVFSLDNSHAWSSLCFPQTSLIRNNEMCHKQQIRILFVAIQFALPQYSTLRGWFGMFSRLTFVTFLDFAKQNWCWHFLGQHLSGIFQNVHYSKLNWALPVHTMFGYHESLIYFELQDCRTVQRKYRQLYWWGWCKYPNWIRCESFEHLWASRPKWVTLLLVHFPKGGAMNRFWLFNGISFYSLFYIRKIHLLHSQNVYNLICVISMCPKQVIMAIEKWWREEKRRKERGEKKRMKGKRNVVTQHIMQNPSSDFPGKKRKKKKKSNKGYMIKTRGDGLERWTGDQKVESSNPVWGTRKTLSFSQTKRECWLAVGVPNPCVYICTHTKDRVRTLTIT